MVALGYLGEGGGSSELVQDELEYLVYNESVLQ